MSSSFSYNPINNLKDIVGSVTIFNDNRIISLISIIIKIGDIQFFNKITLGENNISSGYFTYRDKRITIRSSEKERNLYIEITLTKEDSDLLAYIIIQDFNNNKIDVRYNRFKPGSPNDGGILIIEKLNNRIMELTLGYNEVEFFDQISQGFKNIEVRNKNYTMFYNRNGLNIISYFHEPNNEPYKSLYQKMEDINLVITNIDYIKKLSKMISFTSN